MEWSFNLGGESFRRVEFEEVTSSGRILLLEVYTVGQTPSFLDIDYKDRLQVNVTATETSITILGANRTVDSREYQFSVVSISYRISSAVTILVQCKYKFTVSVTNFITKP